MPTTETETGLLYSETFRLPAEKRDANEITSGAKVPTALRLSDPCFICGRVLKLEDPSEHWKGWYIHLVGFGDHIAPNSFDINTVSEADRNRGYDMGYHPLGSECARKVPITHRRTFK